MSGDGAAIEVFLGAALEWAAGGRGRPLVDAAARALADGVDSPTLRVLAGAPRAFADEDASDLAPSVFDELGLVVCQRLSPAAVIQGARERARRFLHDGGGDARALAHDLWSVSRDAGYLAELAAFSGLDDWYAMIEDGVIAGRIEDVDDATRAAAGDFVGLTASVSRGGLPRPRGRAARSPQRR